MTRTPAVMEIEPCPFCRAHASVFQDDGDYYVSCTECWSQSPLKEEKTEAIAAWNRRTPAEPLADGEMIEKLVRDAYDEGVEDGMERGFDPTDGVPQWIDSVARIETLRAIAAYNPNDRLREALERVAELEGHFEALDRIINESIVVNDRVDRVRWEGVWYDGPLATAFLSMMRVVQKLARAALSHKD